MQAFYMRLNNDGETVAAMDLLVPKVGELMGGSQRSGTYLLRPDAACSSFPCSRLWLKQLAIAKTMLHNCLPRLMLL